jgi:hypothetical protein
MLASPGLVGPKRRADCNTHTAAVLSLVTKGLLLQKLESLCAMMLTSTTVPTITVEDDECAWPSLGTQVDKAYEYLDESAASEALRVDHEHPGLQSLVMSRAPSSPNLTYSPTRPGIIITSVPPTPATTTY